jgi:hypothetical protein
VSRREKRGRRERVEEEKEGKGRIDGWYGGKDRLWTGTPERMGGKR